MKQTGLLFTPENYDKVLAGTKTQTRRLIKPQPPVGAVVWQSEGIGEKWQVRRCDPWHSIICPYGTAGDRLYVKEGLERTSVGNRIQYRCDKAPLYDRRSWPWQRDTLSPLHMPKWAARLWLEITEVRVERIQQISYDDEGREGVTLGPECNDRHSGFIALWESIHGKGSWQRNDWVWVLSYRKVQP